MTTDTSSGGAFWTGWVVTGLVIVFLVFDGGTKVLQVAPVVEACERLGLTSTAVPGIGAVLLAVTALYAIPRTAAVGAILLTAFLGGAVATHVRAGSGWFEIGFAIGVGGLVWLGLVLREPRLLRAILLDDGERPPGPAEPAHAENGWTGAMSKAEKRAMRMREGAP